MRDYRDAGLLRLQDELLEDSLHALRLAVLQPNYSDAAVGPLTGLPVEPLDEGFNLFAQFGWRTHDDGVGRFIDIEHEQWTSGSGVDLL